MRFFESVNGLIVLFKFVQLLFVLLHPAIKATFEFLNLTFEVGHLGLLILLQLLLLGKQTFFVFLELLQTFFLVFNVLLLQCSNLGFPVVSLLGTSEGILLPSDYSVGTGEKSFNFFFIRILNGCLHRAVLLVLAVQVEDHLRQLGDLL
jgi:hypothetical protein